MEAAPSSAMAGERLEREEQRDGSHGEQYRMPLKVMRDRSK